MSIYEKIKSLLDEAGVTYTTEHHEPTITSADASRIRGSSMHAGAKALVIRGSKSGNHFLCVVPADVRLSSKKVTALIGEKFSFASEPEAVTGCVRGSVPPWGSVLGLKTYCDARLSDNEIIHFNAGSITDSIDMRYADYLALEKPEIVDIGEEG